MSHLPGQQMSRRQSMIALRLVDDRPFWVVALYVTVDVEVAFEGMPMNRRISINANRLCKRIPFDEVVFGVTTERFAVIE